MFCIIKQVLNIHRGTANCVNDENGGRGHLNREWEEGSSPLSSTDEVNEVEGGTKEDDSG